MNKQTKRRLASIRERCNERKDIKTLENMNDLLAIALEKLIDDSPTTAQKQKPSSHMMSKTQSWFFSTRKKIKIGKNKMDNKLIESRFTKSSELFT